MSDIDALLKEFESAKKPVAKKDPLPQQQKLPMPTLSTLPKHDFSQADIRKVPVPNPNFSLASEQRRTTILKQAPKPTVEQSLDIDAILQGHSIQPPSQQQPPPPAKTLHPLAPAKNSATSTRRDSLSDWLNEDRLHAKHNSNQTLNLFPQKVMTNIPSKPAIGLDIDDLFSTTNTRDQSATKAPPLSTTKASAKQYYLGNSRYKPGQSIIFFPEATTKSISFLFETLSGINPKQTTVRGDSFNWFTNPSGNSNAACRHLFALLFVLFESLDR